MNTHPKRTNAFHSASGTALSVWPAQVAGSFYPAHATELNQVIDHCLQLASKPQVCTPKALIVPHAGYMYSGEVAAYAYQQLKGSALDKVIILGSNHSRYVPYFKLAHIKASHFQTPLGLIRCASDLNAKFETLSFCHNIPEAFATHIIEVQLPFLQKVLGSFELSALVTGDLTENEIEAAAQLLMKNLDDKTLLIVSSDLSHYLGYEAARKIDLKTLDIIVNKRVELLEEAEACGKDAISILLKISQHLNWGIHLLDYRNSGDTAGPRDGVVGYAALICGN
jgi:AmmeMemoRadiSam system protein B